MGEPERMADLKKGMTHDEAAAHLRENVLHVARYETARMLGPPGPAYFSLVLGVMCGIDYVAALYTGWDGMGGHRAIAKRWKTIAFMHDVMTTATAEAGYKAYGEHVYDIFRCGTVHLGGPKRVKLTSQECSTPVLTWALMPRRVDTVPIGRRNYSMRHLQPQVVKKQIEHYAEVTVLPVSLYALFDDYVAACEFFAADLEAERDAGESALLRRWRSTADLLTQPEPVENLEW
jgi:hypothetical protein